MTTVLIWPELSLAKEKRQLLTGQVQGADRFSCNGSYLLVPVEVRWEFEARMFFKTRCFLERTSVHPNYC